MDQYYMTHPEALLHGAHEAALTNPENPHILAGHLLCAAYEAPLEEEDEALFGEALAPTREELVAAGRLERRDRRWHTTSVLPPAGDVNIRGASGETYLVLNEDDDYRALEEIDAETAFFRVHPGAVHLHLGDPYLVTDLDREARVAFVRRAPGDYYTQPIEVNDVHIVRSTDVRRAGKAEVYLGRLRVRQQVVGYRRRLQIT